MTELADIGRTNEKQRFALIPATFASKIPIDSREVTASTVLEITDISKPADFLIRANQGHSIKVNGSEIGVKLSLDDPAVLPRMVVHGTTRQAWALIVSSGGLKPMGRNHVHFATGLPKGVQSTRPATESSRSLNADEPRSLDPPVVSGMRSSSSVLIYLNVEKTLEAGFELWRSDNGVVLCDGGDKRLIPMDLFKVVEERTGSGKILLRDGQILD